MDTQLPAKLWIDALIRQAQIDGAAAFVLQKGDPERGDILVKIAHLDRTARLLRPATDMDGSRIVLDLTAQGIGPDEPDIDDYVRRARERDRDLWVVEIEDRDARTFVTEPIRDDYTSF